jgi:hypothetical protein
MRRRSSPIEPVKHAARLLGITVLEINSLIAADRLEYRHFSPRVNGVTRASLEAYRRECPQGPVGSPERDGTEGGALCPAHITQEEKRNG